MATNSNDTTKSIGSANPASGFFGLGEVRAATDRDFDYFLNLLDNNDGWIKKLEKNELTIFQKECENSTIKMAKVIQLSMGTGYMSLYYHMYQNS